MSTELQVFILKHYARLKRTIPSDGQLSTLKAVARRGGAVHSFELADDLKISTPAASTRLHALYCLGWVRRLDVGSPSGGPLFRYTLPPELLELLCKEV